MANKRDETNVPVPVLNDVIQKALNHCDMATRHAPLHDYVIYLGELKQKGPKIAPAEFADGTAIKTIRLQREMVIHLIKFRETFEALEVHQKRCQTRIVVVETKPTTKP